MNFMVGKVGARAAGGLNAESAKTAPSKFDGIRSDLAAQLLPPEAVPVTPAQKVMLENDLRQRLQQGGAPAVASSLEQQANAAGTRMQELKQAVSRLPQVDALAPLRDHLQKLEADFQASGDLIKKLPDVRDPQELLSIQVQLYGVSQNLELMSKMVDSVTTGLKTVLDTHVG